MYLIMLKWRHHASAYALRAIEFVDQFSLNHDAVPSVAPPVRRKCLRGTQPPNTIRASPEHGLSKKSHFGWSVNRRQECTKSGELIQNQETTLGKINRSICLSFTHCVQR